MEATEVLRPVRRAGDGGFTLIELMVVVVLMGVLGALAGSTFVNYSRTADTEGTADDVVSALRTLAQRSLAEGRTYCVSFDETADTYTVYRSSCQASSPVATPAKDSRGPAQLSAGAFTHSNLCTVGSFCAYFYPRGTGSPGSLTVSRSGGQSITVTIEGLTSRVKRS